MTERVTAEWTPTRDEMRDSVLCWWKYAPPRLRTRARLIGRSFLLFGAVVIVGSVVRDNALGVGLGCGFGVYGLLAGFDGISSRLAARRLDHGLDRDAPLRFVADARGIAWSRGGEEHIYPWTSTAGVYDAGRYALITFRALGFMAIPRELIGDDGIARLAQFWANANTIEPLPPDAGAPTPSVE